MGVKSVISILLISLLSFNLKAQKRKKIFIKAVSSDVINLNEDYYTKKVNKDEFIFSFGLETLGELNEFVYNRKNKYKLINKKEYKKLKFSLISELNKILICKKKLDKPNSVFKEILIVEKGVKKIKVYPVKWKKITFKE